MDAGIEKVLTKDLPVFMESANQILQRADLMEMAQTERGAKSIVGAMMKAAIFGFRLTPELGQCHILPRNIKGKDGKYEKLASFQIGYKGWQKLAFDGGNVLSFDFDKVCENDVFEVIKGTNPNLLHTPAKSNRGEMTHFWASCTLKSGLVVFDVIDIEEAEKYRRYSETQNTWSNNQKQFSKQAIGIWGQSYETMALRLPIRNICTKKIQISDRITDGIEHDGAVVIQGGESFTPHQVLQSEEVPNPLSPELQKLQKELSTLNGEQLTAKFYEVDKAGKMTPEKKELFTARKQQIHSER